MNSIHRRASSLTILAYTLSFSGILHGQGNFAEFPYNPDANGDDFVGTSDLLELLNLYGSEFSEEGLYVNEDSTEAIIHLGPLKYPKCAFQCKSLPGNWRIATLEDLGMIWDELTPCCNGTNYNYTWLGERDTGESPFTAKIMTDGSVQVINHQTWQSLDCYCSTTERPKVEYTYCQGVNISDCASALVEDGWYPLNGVSSNYAAASQVAVQAFWRWAE